MNTHHLHSGIEKKDSGSQHQIVELGQVGKEPHAHIHVVVSAGSEIDHSEQNQQSGRNDRSDQTAYFRNFADPVQPLHSNERGDPIDDQHHDQRKHLIGCQQHILMGVKTDKCDGNGPEGQNGRIPDRTLYPLQPDRQKTGPRPERLSDPTEHTALFIGKHRCQLGCDQSRRNQENDRRKKVIKCR